MSRNSVFDELRVRHPGRDFLQRILQARDVYRPISKSRGKEKELSSA